MPVMDSYVPGAFCWADLGTPDTAAAKRFYTGLFGWGVEDRPMGPDAFYTMLTVDGRAVAALYHQEPAPTAAPPRWLSYVSVAAADLSAQRTKALGGTVLMDPFDVLDVGRMALVQDPTGAVVALWEPRRHAGAGLMGEPDSICWNELATTDTARAGAFYASLFGWSAETRPLGTSTYTVFGHEREQRGGMLPIAPEWGPMPPHWLLYFAVRDCGGQAVLAQSLGGAVLRPPMDVAGVGRLAVLADPWGADFAVIQPLPAAQQREG